MNYDVWHTMKYEILWNMKYVWAGRNMLELIWKPIGLQQTVNPGGILSLILGKHYHHDYHHHHHHHHQQHHRHHHSHCQHHHHYHHLKYCHQVLRFWYYDHHFSGKAFPKEYLSDSARYIGFQVTSLEIKMMINLRWVLSIMLMATIP